VIFLKVWIGHYKGDPAEWFVVWAKDKHEAFLQIDPIVAEPDLTSLKELTAPGFANFAVSFKDAKGEEIQFSPPAEDVKIGYWLVFGGALGKFDDIEGHIGSRIKKTK
jgi:hypothetical protein